MLVVTRRLLVLTLLALASSAAVLFAQSVSGSVSGTVVDQTRQVLPGATVTLLNEQTGDSRAIQTSDVGAFVFPAVQPGVYTVRIELSGFSPFERKKLRGWPVATIKAGEIIARDGKIVGKRNGHYLPRTPKNAPPDVEWVPRNS